MESRSKLSLLLLLLCLKPPRPSRFLEAAQGPSLIYPLSPLPPMPPTSDLLDCINTVLINTVSASSAKLVRAPSLSHPCFLVGLAHGRFRSGLIRLPAAFGQDPVSPLDAPYQHQPSVGHDGETARHEPGVAIVLRILTPASSGLHACGQGLRGPRCSARLKCRSQPYSQKIRQK